MKVSTALKQELADPGIAASDFRLPVIIQASEAPGTDQILPNRLNLINAYTAELTAREIEILAGSSFVRYISYDAPVQGSLVESIGLRPAPTSAVDQVRPLTATSDLTVALFDTGIDPARSFELNVMAQLNFTRGAEGLLEAAHDPNGHGSLVASLIDGSNRQPGIAPAVRFLSLRVLDENGRGRASDLIRAIQWVVENDDALNISLANFSLGHPALQQADIDPLCRAVEQLVDKGIPAVVSAGELGMTAGSPEVWGGITSPGIAPSAITVGAVNTRGTAVLWDDIATTFSSRGPALQGTLKPDLVAPATTTELAQIGGASLSTAMVSRAVARLLAEEPGLTTRQVKSVLLLTATPLRELHRLEQGHGMLNPSAAVRVVQALDLDTFTIDPVSSEWQSVDGEVVRTGNWLAIGPRIWESPELWDHPFLDRESSFWKARPQEARFWRGESDLATLPATSNVDWWGLVPHPSVPTLSESSESGLLPPDIGPTPPPANLPDQPEPVWREGDRPVGDPTGTLWTHHLLWGKGLDRNDFQLGASLP